MSERTTYALDDRLATITMDDGKVNVMSTAMLQELDAAFEQAESDRAAVLLAGKAGIFSAGFDVKVFGSGNLGDIKTMLRAGAALIERILLVSVSGRDRVYRPCVPDGRVSDAGRRRPLRRRRAIPDRDERGRHPHRPAALRDRDRTPAPHARRVPTA